jgi:uncharacterized membrane protein
MALTDSKIKFSDSGAEKCWFLLGMISLSAVLLLLLNFYIAYKIIESFKGVGWSFLGGLFIGSSFLVTVPALVFSVISIKIIRRGNHKKNIFPMILGIAGTLFGLVLYNATGLWIYIVAVSVLLLISCLACSRKQQKVSANNSEDTGKNSSAVTGADEKKESESTTGKGVINSVKIFQVTGLIMLFITALSMAAFNKPDEKTNPVFLSATAVFLLLLHLVVTIAFFKKKKWALSFKYIESYILLGATVLFFIIALIAEGISITKDFLLIVIIFSILAFVFLYLIKSYKKLKNTGVYLSLIIGVFIISLFSPIELPAQDNNKAEEIYLLDKNDFNPYIEFYSTGITDYFNPEKSGRYPSTNLFDGYLKSK